MIGKKFYKPVEDWTEYKECASWCNNTQRGYIVDNGDYYECVPIPEPTEEEKANEELSELLDWFTYYDEQCMQYQRSLRLGTQWEGNIQELDSQAVRKAKRIVEIRKILNGESNPLDEILN